MRCGLTIQSRSQTSPHDRVAGAALGQITVLGSALQRPGKCGHPACTNADVDTGRRACLARIHGPVIAGCHGTAAPHPRRRPWSAPTQSSSAHTGLPGDPAHLFWRRTRHGRASDPYGQAGHCCPLRRTRQYTHPCRYAQRRKRHRKRGTTTRKTDTHLHLSNMTSPWMVQHTRTGAGLKQRAAAA